MSDGNTSNSVSKKMAKSLKQKGLKLDIDKIVDVESLIEEIKRCYHG